MDPISARMVMAAAGAGAASEVYVEDVFSTFLYEGNGSTQTITNGIDLAGEGGMVWFKRRDTNSNHMIQNTERGVNFGLIPNANANEQDTQLGGVPFNISAFNSDGFDVAYGSLVNSNGGDYASWTFRKAPGFFDVVTYTGDGVSGRTVSHNLGSAPGMIWVKSLTNGSGNWAVFHRSEGATRRGFLDENVAFGAVSNFWNNTAPTATEFTVGDYIHTNGTGEDFVAYIFAHDDARFGPSSNESIIKCGTYTGNGSLTGPVIDLGWEPQFLLFKRTDSTGNWNMVDHMRGLINDSFDDAYLRPDLTNTEGTARRGNLLPNGFQLNTTNVALNDSGGTYVYMAIRRPDKAPAAGTDFFQVRTRTGTGNTTNSSIDFNADLGIIKRRGGATNWIVSTRGFPDFNYIGTNLSNGLISSTTHASVRSDEDSTVALGSALDVNQSTQSFVDFFWKRARGAFDIVFYTGTGVAGRTVTHGLGAIPKAIWVKRLSSTLNWGAYFEPIGNTDGLRINAADSSSTTSSYWNNTSPTATEFTVGNGTSVNTNNEDYVAYLFGNVPGVIDIGSYTGTGVAGLQIDCGFSAGARFVLIKRTDASADWNVFDTARGIVAASDDRLTLNTSNAETGGADLIDPYSPGFEISTTATYLNASGGTYVYMAIA